MSLKDGKKVTSSPPHPADREKKSSPNDQHLITKEKKKSRKNAHVIPLGGKKGNRTAIVLAVVDSPCRKQAEKSMNRRATEKSREQTDRGGTSPRREKKEQKKKKRKAPVLTRPWSRGMGKKGMVRIHMPPRLRKGKRYRKGKKKKGPAPVYLPRGEKGKRKKEKAASTALPHLSAGDNREKNPRRGYGHREKMGERLHSAVVAPFRGVQGGRRETEGTAVIT